MLTTHSPYLVNQIDLSEILWIEKKNGESVVSRPGDKGRLRQLLEDKSLGLADLVFTGTLGE